LKVEVVRAWPRHAELRVLDVPEDATVDDAIRASGLSLEGVAGLAVYGERVTGGRVLRAGERVELLAGLVADPKEARRRRAGQARRS
jgi:putative ubiquitin-RnfH superfamily antitoxin RatB of RatAB toxin-antitoxin module